MPVQMSERTGAKVASFGAPVSGWYMTGLTLSRNASRSASHSSCRRQ